MKPAAEIIADLQAEIALLKTRLGGFPHVCGICWTASWTPVPADDLDAVKLGGDDYARCECCWLHEQVMKTTAACQELDRLDWGGPGYQVRAEDKPILQRAIHLARVALGKGGTITTENRPNPNSPTPRPGHIEMIAGDAVFIEDEF